MVAVLENMLGAEPRGRSWGMRSHKLLTAWVQSMALGQWWSQLVCVLQRLLAKMVRG